MLRIAKMVWVILVGLAIGLSVIGLPLYYQQLQGPCAFDARTCSEMVIPTTAELAQLQGQGWSAQQYALVVVGFRTLQTLVFVIVGLLIFARKSNDRGALVISLGLILFAPTDGPKALAVAYPALEMPITIFNFVASLSLPFLLVGFPDGRIVPRVMWVVIVYWTAMFFQSSFLHLWDQDSTFSFVVSAIGWLGLLVTGVAAQVYRYFRVSTPTQRLQTKWVVLGWTLFLILFLAFALPQIQDTRLTEGVSLQRVAFLTIIQAITLLFPISIGIAILRSRLWDIDVLIRRTVTYAVVVALLLIVYFGSVILLQQIFIGIAGKQPEFVTVLSTLAIAALFVPIRNRIQDAIDRRFNRNKYDAQQVLQKFSETARDETDIDKLTNELVRVVQETMQPKSVTLWLKKEERGEQKI